MRRIFHEWGGTIIIVIAVVALIGLVSLLMQPGGVLNGAFGNIVQSFVDKSESLIDVAGNGAGGSGSAGGPGGPAEENHGLYYNALYKWEDGEDYDWICISDIHGYININSATNMALSSVGVETQVNGIELQLLFEGQPMAMGTIAEDGKSITIQTQDFDLTYVLDESSIGKIAYTNNNDDGTLQVAFAYEKGMTWDDFVNSKFNGNIPGATADEDGYVNCNNAEGYLTYDDGARVMATDEIIENYFSYRFENDL